jgi:hypothetical protein
MAGERSETHPAKSRVTLSGKASHLFSLRNLPLRAFSTFRYFQLTCCYNQMEVFMSLASNAWQHQSQRRELRTTLNLNAYTGWL